MSKAEYNFLLQQGFQKVESERVRSHYRALLFQPIIVFSGMILAIILQSPVLFLLFSGLLLLNTLVPKLNPFERTYDLLIGKRRGYPSLEPAPPPRRVMQGMAATLMLIAGVTLLIEQYLFSYIAQAFIVVAFSALLFGKFCVGAYIYHLLKGNAEFANRTCPWSQS